MCLTSDAHFDEQLHFKELELNCSQWKILLDDGEAFNNNNVLILYYVSVIFTS